MKEKLTADRVKEVLSYDPMTGKFTWRMTIAARAKKGAEAGHVYSSHRTSYQRIRVEGKQHLSHRLAWLIYYGYLPEGEIDHVDGDGLNNAISNLREVTTSENMRNARRSRNNTSGVTGVNWNKYSNSWKARISINGKKTHLGYFKSFEEAKSAYEEAKARHGYSERHGVAS